jgi:hypothetical protein
MLHDINLRFTAGEWDLGGEAAATAGNPVYAPDAITLPVNSSEALSAEDWYDLGAGEPVYVHVSVTEGFAGTAATRVAFQWGFATDAAGTGFAFAFATRAFAVAELVAAPAAPGNLSTDFDQISGLVMPWMPMDYPDPNNNKFLVMRTVITGTPSTDDLTAGKIKAYLSVGKGNGVQALKKFHQSGFTV